MDRCYYNPTRRNADGTLTLDRRRRCRKPATVTVETIQGGLSVGVCETHAPIYTAHGWRIAARDGALAEG